MNGELNPLKTNEYNPNYDIESIKSFTFPQLSELKSQIELELNKLFQQLQNNNVTMDSSLITQDGFPRSDINIIEIRTLRILIIKLQNDLKEIIKELMEKLPLQFNSNSTNNKSNIPFAKFYQIAPNSPAYNAGLQENDKLISIGNINVTNHDNLQNIIKLISSSENVPLSLIIQRDESLNHPINLSLKPSKWTGLGLLGCRLSQL
ncbi:hypothetical protein WICMUC_005955 [Wickerhamomyces mucosus]|uniref:Probable 26S proteasome regulatory subunit p27 n=1 Tax=Wickerhamomyces mucosus TaxID=1378264 RepID=A0A9P8P1M2_9ASCO|nr:hypothetical protein WICMUC_005955 [Wickerhamomyces mucosus]